MFYHFHRRLNDSFQAMMYTPSEQLIWRSQLLLKDVPNISARNTCRHSWSAFATESNIRIRTSEMPPCTRSASFPNICSLTSTNSLKISCRFFSSTSAPLVWAWPTDRRFPAASIGCFMHWKHSAKRWRINSILLFHRSWNTSFQLWIHLILSISRSLLSALSELLVLDWLN